MRNISFLSAILLLPLCWQAQEDTVKVSLGLNPEEFAQQEYNKGLDALNGGDYVTAADLFSRSLQIKPEFDKALSNRAIAYTHLRRYEEALSDINAAISLSPQNAELFFNKSLIFAGTSQRDSQEVALDRTLAIDSRHAEANYYKGLLAFEQKDYDKAIGYYNVAIDSRPAYAFALNDRASAKRYKDDIKGSVADYEAAVKADSTQPFIFNNLGSAYRLNNDLENAVKAYSRALALDPKYLLALINRGVANFDRGQLKQAQVDFEEVLSIDPKSSYAYNNLSSIAIRNKDYKKARELADRAISFDPQNGPAYYNRGIARQMLREEEACCEDWKKAAGLGVTGAKSFISASCN